MFGFSFIYFSSCCHAVDVIVSFLVCVKYLQVISYCVTKNVHVLVENVFFNKMLTFPFCKCVRVRQACVLFILVHIIAVPLIHCLTLLAVIG